MCQSARVWLVCLNGPLINLGRKWNWAADSSKSPQRLGILVAEATCYCQARDLSLLRKKQARPQIQKNCFDRVINSLYNRMV